MTAREAVAAVQSWLVNLPAIVYWAFLAFFLGSWTLALGLVFGLPDPVGPPAVWALDLAMLTAIWTWHVYSAAVTRRGNRSAPPATADGTDQSTTRRHVDVPSLFVALYPLAFCGLSVRVVAMGSLWMIPLLGVGTLLLAAWVARHCRVAG